MMIVKILGRQSNELSADKTKGHLLHHFKRPGEAAVMDFFIP